MSCYDILRWKSHRQVVTELWLESLSQRNCPQIPGVLKNYNRATAGRQTEACCIPSACREWGSITVPALQSCSQCTTLPWRMTDPTLGEELLQNGWNTTTSEQHQVFSKLHYQSYLFLSYDSVLHLKTLDFKML